MNARRFVAARWARAAFTLLILAQLTATAPLIDAQSLPTATLAGKVTAEDGAGLPGTTIRLESESLQGVREISSSATGDFLAALLPAGEYTVTFQAGGMQTVSRSLTLRAASTVRLDQRMRPSAVAESVDVAAEAASAGAPTGPAIEANYKKQVIDRLPVDRSLRSIVLLAPGVTDNGPHGNVGTTNDRKALMLSGALSYSNLFSIDGVVVNENLRGQPYDLFIEDAIEETTVSTGNISAEYGRFTGGVVNAITRSGGNDLKGSFRVTLENDRWTANDPFDRALGLDNRVDHVTESYEETLGGPALKDRLWFFAAGRQAKLSDPGETRLVPRAGDDNPTPTAYVHSTDERRLEGKLTASPVSGYSLVASYTDVKFDENNTTLNTDFLLDGAGLVPREAPYSLLAINASGVPTRDLFLEAQYSRRRFSSRVGGTFDPDPIRGTVILDPSRGPFAGYNSAQGVNEDPELYDNDSYSVKAVSFLPTSSAGIHEIHSGYERFSESARRNLHRSASDFWINGPASIMRGTTLFPTFRPGQTRIEWYPILQPSLGSDLVTDSGFLEDRLELSRHWSFNLGVRYDRNRDRDSRGELVSSSGRGVRASRSGSTLRATGDGRFTADTRVTWTSSTTTSPMRLLPRGTRRSSGATRARASTAIPSRRRAPSSRRTRPCGSCSIGSTASAARRALPRSWASCQASPRRSRRGSCRRAPSSTRRAPASRSAREVPCARTFSIATTAISTRTGSISRPGRARLSSGASTTWPSSATATRPCVATRPSRLSSPGA